MANNTFQKIHQITSGYTNVSDKDLFLLYSNNDKEVKSIQLSSIILAFISTDQIDYIATNLNKISDKLNK